MTELKQPARARRVQLAVPGSNEKMVAKAAASKADHVFIDLEDAVAPSEKAASRAKVVKALTTLDWQGKTRCVRINDLTTKYAYEDIIEVVTGAREHIDTIMIPKVMSGKDVYFVATLLGQIEENIGLEKRIGIEILIEEAEGLQNIEEIASADPRVEALMLGVADLSASLHIDLDKADSPDSAYPGDLWHYARFRLCMAARAAGIDAIDGPFPNFRDNETYTAHCRSALALGFNGKWAIHPAQIEPALEVFTPTAEEIAKARRIRDAFLEVQAKGLGAAVIDGQMADIASLRMLKPILDRADLYGL